MSKQPITHVLLIVDMSGSMAGLAEDVRGGFNTYIADLAKDDGRYRITATVFDTAFDPLCVASKLRDVPKLTNVNYAPRGMTALLDAVGKTVTDFEATTTLAEDERVLVVVQTDGHENSSREFRRDQIAELIKTREATGRWTFIYLGAGVDAWGQGEALGFVNNVNTANSAAGTRNSYSGVTSASVAYASGASVGETYSVLAAAAAVDDDE
jgi:uncharacterized protein YegL